MSKSTIIKAADLFCGAGGASSGLAEACRLANKRLKLLAVNHWAVAVETHKANHPEAAHLCEDLESVNPRKAIPGGKLDLLLAGPSCTHHSTARGGKPVNDQSRASAWCILRWATELQIDSLLIENVREFTSWAPLGSNGRPLKSRKGETFHAFIQSLRSLGYRVEWCVLNSADFGDPTTRERLFIQCRRGRKPIVWPEPTHARQGGETLFGKLQPWRAAREIIDWSLPGESIFRRKKPLSPNTLARIAAGLRKFGGKNAEPFLVLLNGGGCKGEGGARSLSEPTPTVTASGNHFGLCEPFIVGAGGPQGKGPAQSVNRPLQTVMTENHMALVEPFIVSMREGAERRVHGINEPVPTVTAASKTIGLVEPFIISMEHSGANGQQVRSVDQPLATITTRGDLRVCEPFVVPTNHGNTNGGQSRAYPLDRPNAHDNDRDAWGLIEPFLMRYHGNDSPEVAPRSLQEPVPTIDCNDRYALVEPACLDIRFRMLQPHELAAAMSFPKTYKFVGTREQRVRQIGNAWSGRLSTALCQVMVS